MIGLGFIEVKSLMLTSEDQHYTKLRKEVEEDKPEPEPPVKDEPVQQVDIVQESSDEQEPVKPKPKQKMTKQDARQLLKQLNEMLSDDEPQRGPQQPRNWTRRRLKFE